MTKTKLTAAQQRVVEIMRGGVALCRGPDIHSPYYRQQSGKITCIHLGTFNALLRLGVIKRAEGSIYLLVPAWRKA